MATTVPPSSHRLGTFTHVSERRYVMDVAALGITFDFNRVRRERHELVGELIVRCTLPGASTVDGVLSAADFNCSGLQARVTRAKFLADRAHTRHEEIDWIGLLEEFCQRVIVFERQGQAAVRLADLPTPDMPSELTGTAVPLLSRHPVIWFGDGGAAKSLLALYVATELASLGQRVLYADWEFSSEDHRVRFERFCGEGMPKHVWYAWCSHPITEEVERLAGIISDYQIDYLICDSIAFACNGPAETAEAAQGYFRALRQLRLPSLNIAHITKGTEDQGAEQRPFGSIFWHHGARATWFIKRADENPTSETVDIALLQRKANIGPRRREAIGLRFRFSETRTTVHPFDVVSHHELSARLPLWQRMRAELKSGASTTTDLAERLDCAESTIRAAMSRMKLFVRLPDGRIALSARGKEQGEDVPF
jgi:hypothetical protein